MGNVVEWCGVGGLVGGCGCGVVCVGWVGGWNGFGVVFGAWVVIVNCCGVVVISKMFCSIVECAIAVAPPVVPPVAPIVG